MHKKLLRIAIHFLFYFIKDQFGDVQRDANGFYTKMREDNGLSTYYIVLKMSSLILHFSSFKYCSSANIGLLVTTNWIHVYIFETLLWYSYKCFRHTTKGKRVPVDTISFLTYPTERKKKNRLSYSVSEYWFLINISSFMTIVFVWVVHCSSTFITGLNNNEYLYLILSGIIAYYD